MIHVEVRPPAVEQVHRLIAGQKPDVAVRLYAQPGGGGCCGGGGGAVQFGLAFAKPRPEDEVVAVGDFSILVDPGSVKFVDGAVIDYVETLSESGFKVSNPTLPEPDDAGRAGGCGSCGSSSANGGGCGCSG
jgi:iron-sulfur cluster assembly accessory protein